MFQQERLTRLCAWTSSVLDLIVNNIESVIKLFADDTSLSLALNNPDSRAEILNHDLEKIIMNGPKNGKLDLTKKKLTN